MFIASPVGYTAPETFSRVTVFVVLYGEKVGARKFRSSMLVRKEKLSCTCKKEEVVDKSVTEKRNHSQKEGSKEIETLANNSKMEGEKQIFQNEIVREMF